MRASDLTVDIVKSYAQACCDLRDCIEVLRLDGYDLLVVPSRGAHPFLWGASVHAHLERSQVHPDFSMGGYVRPIEQLYLPFTADIGGDVDVPSAAIRGYWSQVLASLIHRRPDGSAYRFYRFLRSRAGGLPVGDTAIRGGVSGRFIFVDTVQSGRAIAEIFAAFDACGLDQCHFVLLVDERGGRLRRDHARAIDAKVAAGRATRIDVDRIFTEDEGPAMSGIWTVTFPELMEKALRMVEGLAETGVTGAALYYHEVRERPDGSNVGITLANAKLSALLFSAIRGDDAVTRQFLDEFRRHIQLGSLQDQDLTRRIAEPLVTRNLQAVRTTVSGSHVIRAYLGEDRAQALIDQFLGR